MTRSEWVDVWEDASKGYKTDDPYLGTLMCKLACVYLAELGHKGTHLFDKEPWDDSDNPLVLLVDGAGHTMTCYRLKDVDGKDGQAC